MTSSTQVSPAKAFGCLAGAVIGLILLIVVVIPFMSAWNNVDAGHIAVVRNGGVFSDSNVRGFLDPASRVSFTGLYSTEHVYPAQQQDYSITADPGNGGKLGFDTIATSTSDGVQMQIQGTLYYQLDLDHPTLGKFDDKFGTREYTWDGHAYHAYDGADGWNAFVNTMIRPVLENDLRQQVATVTCAQLDAGCALVKDPSQVAAIAAGHPNTNGNYTAIQQAINNTLPADITAQLGGGYLTGVHFTFTHADPPGNVQDAINAAQAAYAKVSEAQAEVAQAQAQAQANQAKQQGYNACPSCAIIDELKALPGNITTLSLGGSGGLEIAAK